MAAPCNKSPLLIMPELYRRLGGDVKKSSGRPRRRSLAENPLCRQERIFSAHSGLRSSWRTSAARTSRAKSAAGRESSSRGILWKTPTGPRRTSTARARGSREPCGRIGKGIGASRNPPRPGPGGPFTRSGRQTAGSGSGTSFGGSELQARPLRGPGPDGDLLSILRESPDAESFSIQARLLPSGVENRRAEVFHKTGGIKEKK